MHTVLGWVRNFLKRLTMYLFFLILLHYPWRVTKDRERWVREQITEGELSLVLNTERILVILHHLHYPTAKTLIQRILTFKTERSSKKTEKLNTWSYFVLRCHLFTCTISSLPSEAGCRFFLDSGKTRVAETPSLRTLESSLRKGSVRKSILESGSSVKLTSEYLLGLSSTRFWGLGIFNVLLFTYDKIRRL